MKVPLDKSHRKALSFQDYSPQPTLDGVWVQPLKKHRALEGDFMEYLRLTNGVVENLPAPFALRQVSLSRAQAGRINAFHLHPKQVQDEFWTVIDGTMMVWLADVRASSPTRNAKRRYLLSAEEPVLLYIPAGVAHGYKAGPGGAMLLYAMNDQFNIKDPNEGRLPWDHFGRDIWEEDRG